MKIKARQIFDVPCCGDGCCHTDGLSIDFIRDDGHFVFSTFIDTCDDADIQNINSIFKRMVNVDFVYEPAMGEQK